MKKTLSIALISDVSSVHNVREAGEHLLQVEHRRSLDEAPVQARPAAARSGQFE